MADDITMTDTYKIGKNKLIYLKKKESKSLRFIRNYYNTGISRGT